jgi:hypothetical protein
MAGTPKQAPSSRLAPRGSRKACADGRATYSAAVPKGRWRCAFQIQTCSPMRSRLTPSPTASISPEPSLCGMMSG